MSKDNPKRRGSIGRTLFLFFMAMALLPMGAIALISYQNARQSLQNETHNKLSSSLLLRTLYIEAFFAEKLRHLNTISFSSVNVRFLQTLSSALQKSKKPAKSFVTSFEWSLLVEEGDHGNDLTDFQQTYGYDNLYLMDNASNILFAAKKNALLGQNILGGKLRETLFGQAVQKTLTTGKQTFSDLEFLQDTGKDISGFLLQAVIDDEGKRIGMLVLQLSTSPLNRILEQRSGVGDSEDSYLVGSDLKMRSISYFFTQNTVLKQVVDTELTKQWLRKFRNNGSHNHKTSAQTAKSEQNISQPIDFHQLETEYTDYRGVAVLGAYAHIPVLEELGIEWILVTEIDAEEAFAASNALKNEILVAFLVTLILVIMAAGFVAKFIGRPLIKLAEWARSIAKGNFTDKDINAPDNEFGELAKAFSDMTNSLHAAEERDGREKWLKVAGADLNERLRSERTLLKLGQALSSFLAERLDAAVGVFYIAREDGNLQRMGSYAHEQRKSLNSELAPGEGVAGQSALEKKPIIISNLPKDYISIVSGLGAATPKTLLAFPFVHNDRVEAVVELGSFNEFSSIQIEFLKQSAEAIAISTAVTKSRVLQEEMLATTRKQAESLEKQQADLEQSNKKLHEQTTRLEMQQEALGKSNKKLQEQADSLKASESRLQQQREELRVSNEELEAQAQQLEEQKEVATQKNEQLQLAQLDIERKAEEVAQASRYKSEFLANMSHELRTPLNSLLILSKSLADNEDGNLNEGEVKDAEIINGSANDLLGLINQILDLAKIEAGRMDVHRERLVVTEISASLERQFRPVATKEQLDFTIEVEEGSVETLYTDPEKAGRIVKNLLSNAFKFTSKGGVIVRFSPPTAPWIVSKAKLAKAGALVISVQDSGIGIAADKHQAIFDAFRQEDGSTSRQYGGTGLGLSISNQLARLLKGAIHLESTQGKGSIFSLFLPVLEGKETDDATLPPPLPTTAQVAAPAVNQLPKTDNNGQEPKDDRDQIGPGDRVMLIIEDDPIFATIIVDMARKSGFKCLTANDGELGLSMAMEYKPASIILDLSLPSMDGWTVLEHLKADSETRHIPVHIMSAMDDTREGLKRGAVGYCNKPVTKSHIEEAFAKLSHFSEGGPRTLLLVEDNADSRRATAKLLTSKDIEIFEAATGAETLDAMGKHSFDCMILDMGLPDMSGFDLLDHIAADPTLTAPPVIVYSGRDLTRQEYDRLKAYTNSFVVKGVQSSERLLNEVILFLHSMERNLPEEQQVMIRKLYDQEDVFADKLVLIVDDDVSNLYAMAKQLERKNLRTIMAADGAKALAMLEKHPETDIVLMDIMMPVMDGYEAMGKIRQIVAFEKLPIIALTAKAMSDDKKKCLDAGASDYLTKPVDIGKLLSMMRVWLHR